MKRFMDDIANGRLQQENTSKPFPYVFPQMPPRFRLCCVIAKGIFLIQWGCFAIFCLGSMVLFVPLIVFGKDVELSAMTDNHPLLAFLILLTAISLLLSFLAALFGFSPRLFWRCPCCGHPFPYHVPTRGDNLKEKDCLMAIEGLHIKYVKRKFCPLIIPSVCPKCKCKFFEMAGEFPVRDWRRKSR